MLEYTGAGIGAFLPGIPVRDLSDDEVAVHKGEKALVRTGLYQKPSANKARGGGGENKSVRQEVSDARS
jgi:hypothetical protein